MTLSRRISEFSTRRRVLKVRFAHQRNLPRVHFRIFDSQKSTERPLAQAGEAGWSLNFRIFDSQKSTERLHERLSLMSVMNFRIFDSQKSTESGG